MGAVKAMAINAEQAMAAAGDHSAFRLGLIYAVRQILNRQEALLSDPAEEARALFAYSASLVGEANDLIAYLQEIDGVRY